MVPKDEAHIKLNPPLTWASGEQLSGTVLGLGLSSLLLEIEQPSNIKEEKKLSLRVILDDEQSFAFEGQIAPQQGIWVLQLLPASLLALQDLTGQLRKDQHIEICRTQDVEAQDRFTGFERLSLVPEALPLLDPREIVTEREFLGRTFALPILITGMTGGIRKGVSINKNLALAAAAFKIPMGVGSQRIALDNPEYAPIFKVKQYAPQVFLIGNLGMAQLLDAQALDRCQRAVDMIEADALAIHFNLVQELVQVEGDRHFKGLFNQLTTLCTRLNVPVIAKEVGCGMTPSSARRLADAGVAAIDIGGSGGTSWAHIEGLRSLSPLVQDLGSTFRNWGVPTAYSLGLVRKDLPQLPLIATGGLRDGYTVAKAVGLGATMCGIGLPLLRAATVSEEAVHHQLEFFKRGLELAMLASGSAHLSDLAAKLRLGRPLEAEFQQLFTGSFLH